MGKGRNIAERVIPWGEVKEHVKRDDKWLVIDGDVYDITRWAAKHPGGSRVISHYAGQDASEAFTAFHNDIDYVKKFMKAIHLGRVGPSEKKVPGEEELREDFQQLRETVTKMGCFKPSLTFYSAIIGHIVLLEVIAYLILSHYGSGWIPWVISVLFMATLQTQAGWTQHDFGHLSVFRSSRLNHMLHVFLMNITKGASGDWWNHMHYQHHSKPNVIGKDPDVRLDALFVVGEEMPKTVAQSKKNSMPYNWQHRYFFMTLPPLLFPLYFQYMTVRHPLTRRKYMDLALVSLFYIKLFLVYYPLFSSAISFFMWCFLFRVLESTWFTWVSQSNHIPMEVAEDKERPWASLQMHATCDVEKSFFNDWFTGHLNFQIEHHLFPTMPRHNLYKIAPLVQSFCKKHGLKYEVKSLYEAFSDIIRSLKKAGELWEHYYSAYHMD